MTLTHRNVAGYVAALYGARDCPGALEAPWLYRSNPDANVHMGIIRVEGFLLVITRGSFNFWDWIHDLMARPVIPVGASAFGNVHEGMYLGTPEAWDIVTFFRRTGDRIVFAGHSLGASRAGLLAAHMVVAGGRPHMTLSWGEPLWGFQPMADLLRAVPGASYVNVVNGIADGVTRLPLPVGYMHRVDLTHVDTGGIHPLNLDPFERHHFYRYWGATPETAIAEEDAAPGPVGELVKTPLT